jgi:hypothetical protein
MVLGEYRGARRSLSPARHNDPVNLRDPTGKSFACFLWAEFWQGLCEVEGFSASECQNVYQQTYLGCIGDEEKNALCKAECSEVFCDPGALQACYENCDEQFPPPGPWPPGYL